MNRIGERHADSRHSISVAKGRVAAQRAIPDPTANLRRLVTDIRTGFLAQPRR